MTKFSLIFCVMFSLCSAASANQLSPAEQILAAKQAAPQHITNEASYMVWIDGAFKQRIEGSNGFTCLLLTDPQGRYEPSCLNQEAMRSVFPVYAYQTKMLYQGLDYAQITANVKQKAILGEFPQAGHGGLVYMMSEENKWHHHGQEKTYKVPPHLMFYFPAIEPETMGFNKNFGQPSLIREYAHLSTLMVMMPQK
ncbi:MAG: hypothetical protein AB3N28_00275 [Kordiimonas sp.]